MTTTDERKLTRIEHRLAALASDLRLHETARDRLYAERNALYAEGIAAGVTQVCLARWAGSTPEAVAKALRKLRR